MNIGRLSNNDGEGNANVPSYQMNARLFQISQNGKYRGTSLWSLGTAPKFGLREEIEFVPVFTSSKQCRKKKFNVAFVQVEEENALHVQNLLLFNYLLGMFRLTFLFPSPLLLSLFPGFIDVRKRTVDLL